VFQVTLEDIPVRVIIDYGANYNYMLTNLVTRLKKKGLLYKKEEPYSVSLAAKGID
jgi:predicted transcriptional regulator